MQNVNSRYLYFGDTGAPWSSFQYTLFEVGLCELWQVVIDIQDVDCHCSSARLLGRLCLGFLGNDLNRPQSPEIHFMDLVHVLIITKWMSKYTLYKFDSDFINHTWMIKWQYLTFLHLKLDKWFILFLAPFKFYIPPSQKNKQNPSPSWHIV